MCYENFTFSCERINDNRAKNSPYSIRMGKYTNFIIRYNCVAYRYRRNLYWEFLFCCYSFMTAFHTCRSASIWMIANFLLFKLIYISKKWTIATAKYVCKIAIFEPFGKPFKRKKSVEHAIFFSNQKKNITGSSPL